MAFDEFAFLRDAPREQAIGLAEKREKIKRRRSDPGGVSPQEIQDILNPQSDQTDPTGGGLADLGIDPGIAGLLEQLREQFDLQRKSESDRIAEERSGLEETISGLSGRIGGLREDLIGDITGRGEEYLGGFQERGAERLSGLRDILSQEREADFSESAPDILQLMSGRGLLRSTKTGEALAKERSRLQRGSDLELSRAALGQQEQEESLRKELQDRITCIRGAGLGFETALGQRGLEGDFDLAKLDIGSLRELGRAGIGSLSELGIAGLQRGFSETDDAADRALAERIAKIQGDAATKSAQYGAGTAIAGSDPFSKFIGGIGNLLGF